MPADLTILVVPGACFTNAHFVQFSQQAIDAGIDIQICNLVSASCSRGSHDYNLDVLRISQDLTTLIAKGRHVIIVAHSYGGLPACDSVGAMRSPRDGMFLGFIFVSAFVPKLGMSLLDLRAGKASELFAFNETSCSIVDAASMIFNEISEPSRSDFVSLLVPHNPVVFVTPAYSDNWRSYPCAYIKCGKDRAMTLQEQEENAKRMSEQVVMELSDGDHFPFGSCPSELLASILVACRAFSIKE